MTYERLYTDVITAHLSEMRLQNMLDDYWEHYGAKCHSSLITFYYWPSCPAVNAEN